MATYLMNLEDQAWAEVDALFSPDHIEGILKVAEVPHPADFFVASFVKGTAPLYRGTITNQIDIMLLQSKTEDLHVVCARDTLQ